MPRRKVGIRSMVRFGGTVTLNSLVVYIAYNLEKVLLGRYWGADALGIYGRAYQLINIPTENLNSSVSGVAFSALSRIQNDPEPSKKILPEGVLSAFGDDPAYYLACAVFADDIILVFLGPKWKDAVPIFRLLAPTIVIFALINPFAWLLFSIGLVGRSLKIALVIAPLVIVAYLIGLPYGPRGVAFAYSAAMALWVIPHIAWCIHGTSISSTGYITNCEPAFRFGHCCCGRSRWECNSLLVNCCPLFCGLYWEAALCSLHIFGCSCTLWGRKDFYVDLLRGLKDAFFMVEKEEGQIAVL